MYENYKKQLKVIIIKHDLILFGGLIFIITILILS